MAASFADAFAERTQRLLKPGDDVVVALSGGLDSIALLHLLHFHNTLDLNITAAHYDHAMRADSAADAALSCGRCSRSGARRSAPMRTRCASVFAMIRPMSSSVLRVTACVTSCCRNSRACGLMSPPLCSISQPSPRCASTAFSHA